MLSPRLMSPVLKVVPSQAVAAPFAHKFFAFGAVAAILGIGYLGSHLWLMLHGEIPMSRHFPLLKNHHAFLQIHLFLGIFILGFALQAMPKLLGTEAVTRVPTAPLALTLLSAAAIERCQPQRGFGRFITSIVFAYAAILFARTLPTISIENRVRMAVPITIGLTWLSVGALLPIDSAPTALIVFFAGVIPVILAASQQFFSGVIGAQKLSVRGAGLMLALYGATLLMLVAASQTPPFYQGASASCLILFFTYLRSTTADKALRNWHETPIHFAFMCAFFWAIIGAVTLAVHTAPADAALHIWATGLAVPIIIAVSARIVGVFSGRPLFPERILFTLIALWQVVPLGRGVTPLVVRHPLVAWTTTIIASMVIVIWGLRLVTRVTQLVWHDGAAARQVS